MTAEEYQAKLIQFYQLGEYATLIGEESAAMLEGIRNSETLGPMLDPTAYIRNGMKMQQDKAIIEAVHVFRHAVLKIRKTAMDEQGKTNAQAK